MQPFLHGIPTNGLIVVLGGLNFALEKNVEDLISGTTSDLDDADVEDIVLFAKNAGVELKRSRPITAGAVKRNNIEDGDDDNDDDGNRGGGGGISKDGMSREERRRKSRINKM